MMPTPRDLRRRTMSNSRVTSYSVNAAVGSSMIKSRASCDSARKISTRWRLPTLSEPTIRLGARSTISRAASSASVLAAIAFQSSRPPRLRGAWPMKTFSATVRSRNSNSSW
jgi:hypothetical protein